MGFNQLLLFFSGYLRVYVVGFQLERLLNRSFSEGMSIWGVRRRGRGLEFYISLADFWRLIGWRQALNFKLKVTERHGWPFWCQRFKQRWLWAVSGLLAVLLIVTLTQMVWFVEVQASGDLAEKDILMQARHYGLKPGVFKHELDRAQIERQLALELDRVSRASISFQGTRAVIEILAKDPLPPEAAREPAHVVAARSGVVDEIIAINGVPVVKPGDTVERGQILIRGQAAEDEGVRARGVVQARVWYHGYREMPLTVSETRRTGRTYDRQLIKLGSAAIIVKGRAAVPFDRYDRVILSRPRFRAGWVTVRYYETAVVERNIGTDQAAERAKDAVMDAIERRLPAEADVLDRRETVVLEGPERTGVRIWLEVRQDIGKPQFISEAE